MNESDPLIRRLADANPAPLGHVAGRGQSADHLLADITSGRRPPRGGVRRVRRPWLAVACFVLAAIVVATLILRGGQTSPASAGELLRRTADVASDVAPSSGGGRFIYSKTVSDQLATSREGGEPWSAVQTVAEEVWVAGDGGGRIRAEFGELRFLGPRDRERWVVAGSPTFGSGISDTPFPAGSLPVEMVGDLPTDPGELLQALEDQVRSEDLPIDVGVFVRVAELLVHPDASPELRAALYRAASRLPGIELGGPVVDPLGRTGVAVSLSYDDLGVLLQETMILDETTSALLATELILLGVAPWVDAAPGTRLSFVAYVDSGRVGSIQARPQPLTTPASPDPSS